MKKGFNILLFLLIVFKISLYSNGTFLTKIDTNYFEIILNGEDTILLIKESAKNKEVRVQSIDTLSYILQIDPYDFLEPITFYGVVFEKDVMISGATFYDNIIFNKCSFLGNVIATGSTFNGKAYFLDNTFYKELQFAGSEFNLSLVFTGSSFYKGLNFYKSDLNNLNDFSNILLYDSVYFSFENTTIKDDLDLTFIFKENIETRFKINLYNTDIEKIKLDYRDFLIDFSNRNVTNEQKGIIYHSLLQNQKNAGFIESYQKLYSEYREFLSEASLYKKVSYFFHKYWWNFGFKKERIFLYTFILFMVFYGFNILIKEPQKAYLLSTSNKDKKRSKCYFLWESLVFTAIVMFAFTGNLSNLKIENKLGVVFIAIMYVAGKICLLFLLNYVIS